MEGFNWSILAWIGGLIFVYLFGLFEGRGQGRKNRIEEEKLENRQTPPVTQTVKVDDPGILRLKNDDGKLLFDMDGQRMDPSALTLEQRKRLIEILNVMRPWLEGKPAPPPAPKPVTPPPAAVAPAPTPAPKPKPDSPVKNKKAEEIEAAPTSIVGQINLILQARILNTPLEARGVSLMESVTGGVNVYVGLQRYEAIDDIPDEAIKTAIRAAITEWENKYTPGSN